MIRKKNLREHTTKVHGPNFIPKERQSSGQRKFDFGKWIATGDGQRDRWTDR